MWHLTRLQSTHWQSLTLLCSSLLDKEGCACCSVLHPHWASRALGALYHELTGYSLTFKGRSGVPLFSSHLGRKDLLMKCNKCFLGWSQFIFDLHLIFILTNPFLFVWFPFVDMPKFCQPVSFLKEKNTLVSVLFNLVFSPVCQE